MTTQTLYILLVYRKYRSHTLHNYFVPTILLHQQNTSQGCIKSQIYKNLIAIIAYDTLEMGDPDNPNTAQQNQPG